MNKTMRRRSRRFAAQFLYQHDLKKESATQEDLQHFWNLTEREETQESAEDKKNHVRDFARDLIFGTLQHRDQLDEWIKKYAQNWDLHRMSPVDRNILRLALYEMHFNAEVPPIAAINEAIELAKELGSEESAKFVNGMLDRAKTDVTRPLR